MSRLQVRSIAIFLLAILSIMGVILDQTDRLRPVEDMALYLISPLQRAISRSINQGSSFLQAMHELGSLRAKNEELQDLVDRLMSENVRLREAEIENVTLREQLDFKRANPTYDLLSAEVIGRDPTSLLRYLTIDRGAHDGLTEGMPVVTAAGLVGQVSEVNAHSAKVLLVTDASSSVSALIQNSRATGIVQGEIGRGPVMRYIQQGESVNVGDMVLTSGLGGNFPKRLVIGQVTAVRQRDIEMFQEAEIRPAVDFNRLEMVLVIIGFRSLERANEGR